MGEGPCSLQDRVATMWLRQDKTGIMFPQIDFAFMFRIRNFPDGYDSIRVARHRWMLVLNLPMRLSKVLAANGFALQLCENVNFSGCGVPRLARFLSRANKSILPS
jgi:hypothetical protein